MIRVPTRPSACENHLAAGRAENHSAKQQSVGRGVSLRSLDLSPLPPSKNMTTFPEEVLTRTKKGEIEVRSLIDRGRYVRYNYLHPETGQPMEGGKVKLVLFSESGKTEEYFIIPTKSKRALLIPAAEKGMRKIWDGTKAVDI